MPNRIEEIKARWAAATPGPWVDMPPEGDSGFLVYGPDPKGTPIAATTHVKDLLAIANAPEDIRWLVERLEAGRPCDPSGGNGCPTLAEAQAEIRRLESVISGPVRPDEEPVFPNEFADEDLYRAHVALKADNAALVEALSEAFDHCNNGFAGDWLLDKMSKALSQPHPGAAMLAEVEALRKAVDRCLTAGNHLASGLIGELGANFNELPSPPDDWWAQGPTKALIAECLVAWRVLMDVSNETDAIRNREGR